ncbi:hypothetical protein [Mycobacterium sp.]|uniref:hypothetical protein n=1 Tax=Mycobacterium sp. TaxID=1785 RepID=UPI003BB12BE9
MSGLEDAANDAHAAAEVSFDPGVHAVKNALEAALAAERAKGYEPADLTGIPAPEEACYVSQVRILKGGTEN